MTTAHELGGRVIVVTGAARGQGAAIAGTLADLGAQVVAVDLGPEAPPPLRRAEVRYRTLNVSDESAWRELQLELRSDGSVHGLVNNAGITHRSRIGATERADWDRVLAVNLTGPMLGIQAIAPLMGRGASIVSVGSSAALTGHYPVAYSVSKWGLRGLTHVAATELGPRGIRVNLIHPGFIETEMTATAPAVMRDVQLELTPLERTGEPHDIAHLTAFLLSGASAYISGAEIPVDGGYTSSAGAKPLSDRLRLQAN
ncbi:SDR family NAD(P)-dependent oxidoreductase [Microbacterium aoyamense]|uniref:SDR family NAD(P)-dependent oxidoreductase n=1 Tax=Microbacterium aoyamense TaxID=344166 RepID=A0ABP5B8J0_9MICO|nr:SDR family NAD(P)-dependent oxidoreductase [Microbacterium aoyamense]